MHIADVRVYNYAQPAVPLHRKRFKSPQEMTLVEISTDTGLTGYGVARAHGGTSGAAIGEYVHRTLKPLLIEENPLHIERIWKRMWRWERGPYAPVFAMSIVDVALWDLKGKILGAPLVDLLGGGRDHIPAYASSAQWDSIRDYLADFESALAAGFRAYKIHPFDHAEDDIRLCEAISERCPDGIRLMLDPAQSYERAEALRVGKVIEDLGFYWYEEPINHYDIDGYRQLCRDLSIPVAGAETISGSAHAVKRFLVANAADMVMGDVYWKMGVTGLVKTALLCETFGVKIGSHHGGSPLMNVANLHVLCALSNADMIEVLVPTDGYDYGLNEYPALDADGRLRPPTGPGLGVEIDWEFVKANLTSEM